MKAVAALLVLVSFGILAAGAHGDLVPAPTVPAVTVSLPPPPLPVPLPTIPKLPTPVLPAPAQAAASTASAAAQSSTHAVGSPSAPSSSSQSSSSRASNAPRSRQTVRYLHSSRPWIGTTGAKGRRGTTLTFVLPRAARVVFVVQQVSPGCHTVGRFVVHGHAGLNRVRFAGRVHGQRLGAGTYRISAHTPGARSARHVTIVIVAGSAPTKAELASARASNVCSGARSSTSTRATANFASEPQAQSSSAPPKVHASASAAREGPSSQGGILGSTAEKTARAIRPALVALLAAAILLLGLASLPKVAMPDPRLNELLAKHRLEIAGVGAVAFVAVVIAFLIG